LTRINLIPVEIVEAKKKRYGNFVLAIIVLLNFIFLFSCLGMIAAQKARIRTAAELQASENTKVEDFITRLNFYDQEKKELLVRTNVLKEIGSARVNWSAVLQDIGMLVPSNIELTSIQGDSSIFEPQDRIKLADSKFISPEAIVINGNAPTYLDVSNFLIRLKMMPVIETGSYAASNSIVQDQKVVTFTIKLMWRNVAVMPELAQLQKEAQEKEKAQELQQGEETEEGQIQEELQQETSGG
jgi:Tfp pilus assembly protein PilN